MKKILFVPISIFFLVACNQKPVEETIVQDEIPQEAELIASIEQAHKTESYYKKELIQFDLNLVFGGKKRFDGTIKMTPSGGLVKMTDSSKTLIWDGKTSFSSDSSYKSARFGLLTWSYFFAAPYKLSDPGTNMEYLGGKKLNELSFETGKLTFGENVGDSPDDWYIVYKEKELSLLAAMAYIVTASSSVEEAEEDPHAITYEAYTEVGGIPFATQWNFWTWNEQGELNKLLGSATISNIKFIKNSLDEFKIPS